MRGPRVNGRAYQLAFIDFPTPACKNGRVCGKRFKKTVRYNRTGWSLEYFVEQAKNITPLCIFQLFAYFVPMFLPDGHGIEQRRRSVDVFIDTHFDRLVSSAFCFAFQCYIEQMHFEQIIVPDVNYAIFDKALCLSDDGR